MSVLYGVIGNPISHSLSPDIHHAFAKELGIDLNYIKIEAPLDKFEEYVHDFFYNKHGLGLNVTLPFKSRAYELASIKSEEAIKSQAANTLKFHDNKIYAYNTDGMGLVRDLKKYIDIFNKKILIIGAGGAAKGIIYSILKEKPSKLILTNRTIAKAYELQKLFKNLEIESFDNLSDSYDIIINATSAGTKNQELILPDKIFNKRPFCYDLAYSKTGNTSFIQFALEHGLNAKDGMGMLIEQAAKAFYIWHGVYPVFEGRLQSKINLSP